MLINHRSLCHIHTEELNYAKLCNVKYIFLVCCVCMSYVREPRNMYVCDVIVCVCMRSACLQWFLSAVICTKNQSKTS